MTINKCIPNRFFVNSNFNCFGKTLGRFFTCLDYIDCFIESCLLSQVMF